MNAHLAGTLSLLVPGAGQLLRQRWGDAALFLFLAVWLRLILSASAQMLPRRVGLEPLDAAIGGLFAFPGGYREPLVVIVTVVLVAIHAFAAWDAWRR